MGCHNGVNTRCWEITCYFSQVMLLGFVTDPIASIQCKVVRGHLRGKQMYWIVSTDNQSVAQIIESNKKDLNQLRTPFRHYIVAAIRNTIS